MARKRVGVLLLFLFFLGFFLGGKYEQYQLLQQPALELSETVAEVPRTVFIHVTGAVQQPGVYELTLGKRVEDVLLLAGLSADAAADQLNRAALLRDGEKIVVPTIGQASSNRDTENTSGMENGLVNLNQANLHELMSLPGIGEVKGQAILDYREANGGFQHIDEIKNVTGIGEGAYTKIKEKICV